MIENLLIGGLLLLAAGMLFFTWGVPEIEKIRIRWSSPPPENM